MGVVQTAEQLGEQYLQKFGKAKNEHQPKSYSGDNSTDSTPEIPEVEGWTVCAPQLLHLDINGNPMWFNGWITSNKFEDEEKQIESRFDVWLTEPLEKKDAWQLYEHNEACLTADAKHNFTDQERSTLDMIFKTAKELGAYRK